MIDAVVALEPPALDALAELERRVVAADGDRLKLEWGVLRDRRGTAANDLLWWDGPRLVGFLGIYGFGPPDVELAGAVDPEYRRRGIATQLLAAALPLCRERAYARALLVTPRNDAGGREFAAAQRAPLEHSEYALAQRRPPAPAQDDPAIALRAATVADLPDLRRLFAAGFGDAPENLDERFVEDGERTLVVLREGETVGTLRVHEDPDGSSPVGVYGFTVDPAWQGRGIGREVLRRVCAQAWESGASGVRLEVAVDNPGALHLYTSLGFEPVTTEDYYAVDL